MNCIKNTEIQEYIDGELSLNRATLIEEHLAGCAECSAKVAVRKQLVLRIKEASNILAEGLTEIPEIKIPQKQKSRSSLKRQIIIYSISAACILFFLVMVLFNKKTNVTEQQTIIYSLVPDVDANLPITKQRIVINVTDINGYSKEVFIK